MKIIKKPLSELHTPDYNPRINIRDNQSFYKKLYNSIKKYGIVEPIIWNKQTGNVVGGNQRLAILQDDKVEETDVVEIDVSLNDEKALNLALNKITGDWDNDKLNTILMDLKLDDPDLLDWTGFDIEEINEILDKYQVVEEDEFELPPEPKYKVQRGDIYKLGNHHLMCGDSCDSGDVKRLCGDNKIDLLLTDPPYGVDYSNKNTYLNAISRGNRIQTPIENDAWKPEDMPKIWLPAFINAKDALKDGGVYYIFSADADLLLLLLLCIRDSGLQLKQLIVWVKNNIVLGRRDYKGKHENLVYGWKEGSHKFYGETGESTVWEYDKPNSNRLHPTMKPIELLTKAIINSSQNNEIVLDLFGDSGSTLIACEQTQRRCYMMEIDPYYCSVIIERWEQLTGKQHEQINT